MNCDWLERQIVYKTTVEASTFHVRWPTVKDGAFETDSSSLETTLKDAKSSSTFDIDRMTNEFTLSKIKSTTSRGSIYKLSFEGFDVAMKIISIGPSIYHKWVENTNHLCGINDIYRNICFGFIDATASMISTTMLTNKKTPHLPYCYTTGLARNMSAQYASKEKTNKECKLKQIILMEHLNTNFIQAMQNESKENVWWSMVSQLLFGLVINHDTIDLVHNDAHLNNFMMRDVDVNSILSYRLRSGETINLPTYGKILVFIDFGRACCKINDIKCVSCEFTSRGQCKGMMFDCKDMDYYQAFYSVLAFMLRQSEFQGRESLSTILFTMMNHAVCLPPDIHNIETLGDKLDKMRYNRDLLYSVNIERLCSSIRHHWKDIVVENSIVYDVPIDLVHYENMTNLSTDNHSNIENVNIESIVNLTSMDDTTKEDQTEDKTTIETVVCSINESKNKVEGKI